LRPLNERIEAWRRLARDLDKATLDAMTTTIGLTDAIDAAEKLLKGEVRGRLIVDVNR
jgi:acrylyl-CoA reductase (NADPH)